ncbi:MAG: NERD domain-containing protein [Candidatus Kariarchaeaceae archaeon]|jgi:hypothetical protein
MEQPDWMENLDDQVGNPYINLLKRVKNLSQEESLGHYLSLQNLEGREKEIISGLGDKVTKMVIILEAIRNGLAIERITRHLNWQDFEQLIAAILSEAEWEVVTNYRFFSEGSPSTRTRFEVDVLAWKRPYVLLIDCKRHAIISKAPTEKYVQRQIERTYEFFDMIPIIHDSDELKWTQWLQAQILPMIITWRDPSTDHFERVPICPIVSLRDLLTNFDEYRVQNNWFALLWKL